MGSLFKPKLPNTPPPKPVPEPEPTKEVEAPVLGAYTDEEKGSKKGLSSLKIARRANRS